MLLMTLLLSFAKILQLANLLPDVSGTVNFVVFLLILSLTQHPLVPEHFALYLVASYFTCEKQKFLPFSSDTGATGVAREPKPLPLCLV